MNSFFIKIKFLLFEKDMNESPLKFIKKINIEKNI